LDKSLKDQDAFTALGSTVRGQILVYISHGCDTFPKLASRFDFSGPALLYHLKTLEKARLIQNTGPHGASRYVLDPARVAQSFLAFLDDLNEARTGRGLPSSGGSTSAVTEEPV